MRTTWKPGRIRERRKTRGLSVAQLATILGVSRMTVYRWERGTVQPRLPTVEDIADALGTTPSHFWIKEVEDGQVQDQQVPKDPIKG